MEMGVRKLPKKRKFDPSELEDNQSTTVCVPVSVVQSTVSNVPQSAAVDYSRSIRIIHPEETQRKPQATIDLSEWCDHRVLAKQGDWYHPGVIRQAIDNDVSPIFLFLTSVMRLMLNDQCTDVIF